MAKVPEINAGSMADISFLMLIFFIVTASMDTDTGLARRLPPIPEKNEVKKDQEINRRNVFTVLLDQRDRLLVNGKLADVSILREKAKEFIANPNDDPSFPTKKSKEIDLLGAVMVPEGVISLQNDRGTTYKAYMKVQNELMAAYNELRDEMAKQYFGKHFNDLLTDQQDAIKEVYPQRISEAEPKNIGGNN